MFSKKIAVFLFPVALMLASAVSVGAQDATSQSATAQPTPDAQQQEEKLKLEAKAIALLDQIVTEAQGLKLPENRIRVQIAAADMLWDRSAARARGLLVDAGAILSQMMLDADLTDRNEIQTLNQLRQDLVLTAGRHDAELAYQLLHSTQQQPAAAVNAAGNRRFVPDQQSNLEQNLLATIAASDPKVAYQKASESLDKGEYPTALSRVLSQLQAKDPESFKKLSDKALSRLSSDSIMASREAAMLSVNLLMPGPRAAGTSTATPTDATAANSRTNSAQILSESAYHDLMDNAITAALSVTSLGAGGNNNRGGGARVFRGAQPNQQNPPDEAQVRQNNARIMLLSLQNLMPQIDQYLPERAQAVRQKLTELGMGNSANANFGNQMRSAMQQG